MKENFAEEIAFSEQLITEQLERIFANPLFLNSEKLKQLLSFVVKETIAGRANQIKEYTIGVNVLEKPVNFRPQVDGIVRIHAGRLRRALNQYYKESGENDPIVISLPTGSYVPVFEHPSNKRLNEETAHEQLHKPIIVAILPFKHYEKNITRIAFVEGLGELLTTELSRFQDISIIAYHTMRQIPAQIADVKDLRNVVGARYVVAGNIQFQSKDFRIAVQLINTETSEQIWSKVYERQLSPHNMFAIQDDIVSHVISELSDYCGVIVRHVAAASKLQRTNDLDVFNAVVWYYHFHSAFTAEAFHQALTAMELAVKREPNYAMAWSCLGELYMNAYLFNHSITGNVYERGLECALKAIQLDPHCQSAYVALALANTYLRNKKECHQAIDQCINLNPKAITLVGMVGFLLITSGENERGFQLVGQSIKYNRFYPPWFNGGIAFYYILHKDYKQAYYWAKKMNLPGIAWDYLLRASILGHLNRVNEARATMKELLKQNPEFPKRAQEYINFLILNEELANALMEGLEMVGLSLLKVA